MGTLADGGVASTRNGTTRDVGELAIEMRTAVTPVIGYLELISDERRELSPDRHLHWIATIERRLEVMQELNDQIARICAVLRESVNDPEAATRPAPEPPAD
jgi:hypothetical protein